MCPSWRVWREPVSRCSPGDFGACGGALRARRKGAGAAPGGGGGSSGLLRAAARGASAPCRPLPALAPARCILVALFPVVPGLWNSCVCKLLGEGRGCTLVRRAHGPLKLSGACQGLEGAARWRQSLRVPIRGPAPGCCSRPGTTLAERAARPLQHPEMGGRKIGAIAEGEEREKCWCPLPCSSCPGGVTH